MATELATQMIAGRSDEVHASALSAQAYRSEQARAAIWVGSLVEATNQVIACVGDVYWDAVDVLADRIARDGTVGWRQAVSLLRRSLGTHRLAVDRDFLSQLGIAELAPTSPRTD
ncbi:hypothetical protein ABT297_26935 [Dactylosporangium sp. NPDC000555]|uniref:hypothetical protein n=1 Tax=Dactylosporangium sp. NPDC000555 TaxID=3154260 RepID=UPI00332EE292